MKYSSDRSGFVNIGEIIPDIILEIRYYTTFNFVGERIDGYEMPLALLTREAASALREVNADAVSRGYKLRVYDAYRPQSAVDHFMRWGAAEADIRMKEIFYPDIDKSRIIPEGYVAGHSSHTRGSTVDLTLFDAVTQKDLDMGGAFDLFGEISHPDYRGITDEQYENRMLLRDLMLEHGFIPIDQEWWHFTLKDEPYPDTYFTFPIRWE